MPKQNRPFVRDGRIQGKRKRTDRSYLRPAATAVQPQPAEVGEPEPVEAEQPEAAGLLVEEVAAPAAASVAPPAPAQPAAAPAAPVPQRGKLPTSIRAVQQQGVRKRREFDLQALARRDTQYAIHELRRIFILATMVIVTLIVLGFVLR